MDENDSELETIKVPMLDSSPGGKKSFRIQENEESTCDIINDVDNVQIEKPNGRLGSDYVNGKHDVPIVIAQPLPLTPGVRITLPSPCEGSSAPSSCLNESSPQGVKPYTSPLNTQSEQALDTTENQSSSPSSRTTNEPKIVVKRQPPPLPPRGVVSHGHKSVENSISSSSCISPNTTLPAANTTVNVSPQMGQCLSAESAGSSAGGGMTGSLTPRRLSAAASSLSEGKQAICILT